jgi:PleD family two-component response regulator
MMTNSQPQFNGNILIVDDSFENLRVLSAPLIEQGYKVRCVRNGALALLSVKSTLPELILLDIRMPEMSGYEVCQQLKADAVTRDIPIIFISALDEPLDKVKAFEAGGRDYITKPFQVEEVLVRVANQLTIQRLQRQVEQQGQQLQQTQAILESLNQTQNQFLDCLQQEVYGQLDLLSHYHPPCPNSPIESGGQSSLEMIHHSSERLLVLLKEMASAQAKSPQKDLV